MFDASWSRTSVRERSGSGCAGTVFVNCVCELCWNDVHDWRLLNRAWSGVYWVDGVRSMCARLGA